MDTQGEQEKMDQLMAELQGTSNDDAAGQDSTDAPPADDDPDAGLSDQEKMDKLMAELQAQAGPADPQDPSETENDREDGAEDEALSEQAKMDQLMAELQGEVTAAADEDPVDTNSQDDGGPDEDLGEQEKMDRLMAELQTDAGAGEEASPPEAPAAEPPPDEELDEQAKMDRLMAELQGGDAAAPVADPVDSKVELTDQEKMDRLMAELQGNPGQEEDRADQKQAEAAVNADDEAEKAPSEADDFQPLDDDEADLDGYGEADADTFEPLDDGEDDLAGYANTDEGGVPADDATMEAAPEAEPDPRPKPVGRERKSLFKIQEERVAALPERIRQSQWPRLAWVSAGITILLALAFIGFQVYLDRGAQTGTETPAETAAHVATPRDGRPEEVNAPAVPDEAPVDESRLVQVVNPADNIIQDRFATIDTLRQSLQIKQAEIISLKEEYAAGNAQSLEIIDKLIAEHDVKDFKTAMDIGRIAYELKTMQRRRTYIHRLNAPHDRLLSGSEALLYIKRLTEIDLAVAPFVGGLGTGQLLRRIDGEIDRHQLTGDKLQLAAGDVGAPSLESLWDEVAAKSRSRKTTGKVPKAVGGEEATAGEAVQLSNPEIWEQICKGRTDNKYRLTELSTEAAACLAKWKGKELFLNRLKTLTSRQARALADWQGEWICLNGLTEIDRATARALFRWKGKRLSLNGFAEVPPGIARYLARWKGQQLELMGLELLSHKTAVYFSEWKKAGGQLYIPNKFYRRK